MISDQAVVDPSARIADAVEISPFSVIGPNVEIGEGSWIGPHVVIKGPTTIGKRNKIYQFASVGEDPQDVSYRGEPTRLEIGDDNIIREYVTINRGTMKQDGLTRIGHHNLIMAYVHVAHDCIIHDHVILANMTTLAGHIEVMDHAMLGGGTLVHQFCRIGPHAFTAGGSGVMQDVPPHVLVKGNPAVPRGLNLVGLRRRGFTGDDISVLKKAYRALYRSGLKLEEARAEIDNQAENSDHLKLWQAFIASSDRGIVRPDED